LPSPAEPRRAELFRAVAVRTQLSLKHATIHPCQRCTDTAI
jgi:hypothetical protein